MSERTPCMEAIPKADSPTSYLDSKPYFIVYSFICRAARMHRCCGKLLTDSVQSTSPSVQAETVTNISTQST